ncbi:MAG: short-chain dehydrogenase/reductase [Candidatus Kerfeldbacteria bacterium CG15_BIG_FIL_POST_REV_8_21_14_020_45_12]|uniref:Short-chain dehydrogenase/reductase n=1 Tax=Candidatus Kerfeldbacteria bacterium CG15_BIG_FIL_POST_REV_8_21_14_020_45_12 TaxID=2014247 RepID=A0A2M7H526_9BACT|nr:MAG: short-chain dehydrogenase/reductase [Candidatus Kerfeldbacteria bacterium CG15_BIG_FIL_POST_REV_8_21_14_020_45_12]PJA93141.1 MAG: short-chain dehydrogenase/reductase [Candidatus Kerfeldbacteria bacterium CG_4_9_14_3_um_filter_45_8]
MNMNNKTVFITGASSGIGLATADLFWKAGWNVVATMRSPERAGELLDRERTYVLALDVTDRESINQAVAKSIQRFGKIDVLINNAGYGLVGPFEPMPAEKIEKQFNTNVLGLMSVTQSLLPHFRGQKAGVIVNISSIGGRVTFPLYSVYHGTKWAVEGFTESLSFELRPQNIKVRLVEPGAIKTDFYGRSMDMIDTGGIKDYDRIIATAMPRMQSSGKNGASPADVAKVIYRSATAKGWKLRYPAAGNAPAMLWLRRLIPVSWFMMAVRWSLLR